MPSRAELFRRVGIIPGPGPRLHKRTIQAWHDLELDRLNTGRFRSSFWGGMFPYGEKPCPRKALYGLMNLPVTEPAHPKLAATSGAGSNVEKQITYRWGRAGLTIGGSVPLEEGLPDEQLRIVVPGLWISTAIDSVLDLRPEHQAVVPVDIKSKADKVIEEMKIGVTQPDPRHVAQVVCYVYVCRMLHEEMGWRQMGLEPAEGGFIYYVSRDNPANAKEFWIEPDWGEVVESLALLGSWKQNFIEDRLPARPKAWRWTELPCKWCDVKKLCKEDMRAGIEKLSESHTIAQALKSNPEYNLAEVKEKVLKRWEEESA